MAIIYPSYAGVSFGDTDSEYGKLTVSGYVRANYQDKHYGESASDQKIRFDAAQLNWTMSVDRYLVTRNIVVINMIVYVIFQH